MDNQTDESDLKREMEVPKAIPLKNESYQYPSKSHTIELSRLSNPTPHSSSTANGHTTPEVPNDAPYSTFSNPSKAWITLLVAMSGFFSPLSANIYFPALSYIALDLHVSLELINLTITATTCLLSGPDGVFRSKSRVELAENLCWATSLKNDTECRSFWYEHASSIYKSWLTIQGLLRYASA